VSKHLTYADITARAELEIHYYLQRAAVDHAGDDTIDQALSRGAALGALSLWDALATDLAAFHTADYTADRARLTALVASGSPPQI
jgi:hypothetical protein